MCWLPVALAVHRPLQLRSIYTGITDTISGATPTYEHVGQTLTYVVEDIRRG